MGEPCARLIGRDPCELRKLVPKPGELTLGVMTGIGLADLDSLFSRDLSGQISDQRRHAMGFHRRQQRIEPARSQSRNLFQRPCLHHRPEALVDSRIKFVAVRRQEHRDRLIGREQWRQAFLVPVPQRAPCCLDHFESACDAGAVARFKLLRGDGIAP